jgi:hypothetical protein
MADTIQLQQYAISNFQPYSTSTTVSWASKEPGHDQEIQLSYNLKDIHVNVIFDTYVHYCLRLAKLCLVRNMDHRLHAE